MKRGLESNRKNKLAASEPLFGQLLMIYIKNIINSPISPPDTAQIIAFNLEDQSNLKTLAIC